ncbi:uncharacterized protein LOC6565721 [Drosophila grimshawi]|uniref:GH24748 n=1 Tax=Drosophila grimshawi TaxID=7222 RepID=B4JN52_DROGR|nr:uncharacterized protein LOC6565721 [Drosophila grimshawi]EDV92145.1 GH24748 [Drosophila grimshawi]
MLRLPFIVLLPALPLPLLLLLLMPLRGANSATYGVTFDERIFQSCSRNEDKGNVPISDLVDTSEVTIVLENDYETFHFSGDIIIKKQLPNVPIKVHVEIYHLDRGEWVPTVAALKRDDFCKSLKDRIEPWHLYYISQIPKDQRTCPPHIGQVYKLRNVTNRMTVKHMPYWNVDGDLKAVMHFSAGDIKICAVMYFTVTLISKI